MSFAIFDVMLENKYTPNTNGICYGLACMAAQEVIRGDGAFYKDLVAYVVNHGAIDDNV